MKTVETGKEALNNIQKTHFNVCLIDLKLPDMDGTEILRTLKNDYQTVKIMITGYSSEEAGAKAADYGADDFLVKPVQPQELLASVKENLEKH